MKIGERRKSRREKGIWGRGLGKERVMLRWGAECEGFLFLA